MTEFPFLGPFRKLLRRELFTFIEKALDTHDGRLIVNDVMKGLTSRRAAAVLARGCTLEPQPYSDLGVQNFDAASKTPVFITARFRSGSTLLWNIFRHIPECTAYYEPLNERRWFDPLVRGNRIDKTHIGVDDYSREYDGLEDLGKVYQENWIDRNLFMDARFWEPNLAAYIQALIDAASNIAVLQFNRVDFRLPWLRHNFPQARIIHLYRHPRDQWCSALVDPTNFPKTGSVAEFEPHDHFYLLAWARDLSVHFPFLNPETADHPYDVFYYIWKLSYLYGRHFADASICFESLCETPDHELPRLLRVAGLDKYEYAPLKKLIVQETSNGRWRRYADTKWFEERESSCETILARYISSDLRCQPSAHER